MSKLKVAGAELSYEVAGAGPLLVLIAGAQGSADVFQPLAQELKPRFTVLTYDRRGFSGSTLDGAQDYDRRLDTDADDVARLIDHAGGGPAHVFGNSSGAIVALQLLVRHPEAVRTLVAHEPPAVRHLPDPDGWIAQNNNIYETYRAQGIPAAMRDFAPRWLAESDRAHLAVRAATSSLGQRTAANMIYWFEHELRQYPPVRFDMQALEAGADRLVFVAGEEMRDYPPYRAAAALADRLRLRVIELPGGHLGFATVPGDFARAFCALLAERKDSEAARASRTRPWPERPGTVPS